ncbi:hypothetical protein [Spirillospora albida]|uniref:hypothetical protein n=1 Tax=Spirillospora albida TaxID=58123 RepID=UPI0012F946A9|nr:hypothetical protein [Spirillospora albida]
MAELHRRVQVAVWALAATGALFGWTIIPWLERGRERYSLWEVTTAEGMSGAGLLLYPVLILTMLLGVAAGAAGTRPTAVAACASGVVTNVLIAAFIADPGRRFETQAVAEHGQTIALGFTIVFLIVASTTPRARSGPLRRRPQLVDPSENWMDPSFGTIDKRYYGRR